MISVFREFTKSWVFKGLMVVLVGCFAVFGIGKFGNLGGATGDDVVTAGSRKVSSADFKSKFENYRRNYEQQSQGQSFTNEEYVKEGGHTRMLNEIADETAFMAWLDSMGIKPSTKLLLAKIGEIPQFYNSVTGRFDTDTYKQVLANNQINTLAFESEIRDNIAQQQYFSAAAAGLQTPRIYSATAAALGLQTRDASLFVLSDTTVAPPPEPTDAQLQAFYNEVRDKLTRPEIRAASVVEFSPQQYLAAISVDEAELHKMYDFRRNTLATPETRSFVQLTAKDIASAAKMADALKAGQAPEAVAKTFKGQVITYTAKPKTAVSDTKVGDAAFALQTGQVSTPIQGDLGIAVVKMGEIKIGSTPSFDSVHDELVKEYKQEKAADKVNEVSHAFSDAINKGEDFDATAKRLQLTVSPLPPVSADGKAYDPRSGSQLMDPKTRQPLDYSAFAPIIKAVFDLQQPGSASDVEEIGSGQFFAVKLNGIIPGGAPPLAQVRDPLIRNWKIRQVEDALSAQADEAVARLNKGETMATVAASYHTNVHSVPGLGEQNARQSQLPGPVLSRLFSLGANSSFQAPVDPVHVVVGRVDAIHQAAAPETNMRSTMIVNQVSGSVASDVRDVTTSSARKVVKTTTNINAVLRVLNVDAPADATPNGKDSKGKS